MKKQVGTVDRCAYCIDEFCASYNISRAMFYKILRNGQAPRIMKVGCRTVISVEAAEAWRREMEAQATKCSGVSAAA